MTDVNVSGTVDLVSALQRRAGVATSLEAFGEAIVRATLSEAVRLVKEGAAVEGRMEIPAKIFIRFIPDPAGIDVGFEECMSVGRDTALHCYVEAHAPRRPHLR